MNFQNFSLFDFKNAKKSSLKNPKWVLFAPDKKHERSCFLVKKPEIFSQKISLKTQDFASSAFFLLPVRNLGQNAKSLKLQAFLLLAYPFKTLGL